MNWLSFIPGIFKGGKEVAEVFTENKEKKGRRGHLERIADMDLSRSTMEQFSAEFHARENRSWWDSFVDGLNRLPRPLITIAILGFFVLAPLNPERFLQIAKAYELMPAGYWALLSVIIGFYFGGRMQLKQADMKVKAGHLKAAQELVAMKREFRELREEDQKESDIDFETALREGVAKPANKAINAWLAKKIGVKTPEPAATT